jgi:hypothetical protein
MTFRPNHAIIFLTAIFVTAIFAAAFLLVKPAAAATSTVRGAAWWGSQSEYMYLDCLDDVIGDQLDVTGNLNNPPPPLGFHFTAIPCGSLIHHVYLNDNGNFSGSAWSYTKGLVSFDATTTPPDSYAFNSSCPSPLTCTLANNCWACYNETDQKVYGWARVVTDGTWIRLNTATTTPVKLQSWNLASSVLPGHNILPGDFVGNATTSADTLSFNCESEGGGAGNCAARSYKVYIGDLRVGHLSAPNWSYSEACSSGALRAVLHWDIKSGTQTGYEVVANSVNTLSTSTATCWSGVKSGVAAQYAVPNADPNCTSLNYNTNYYWWVRLYDANGSSTPWYQFGVSDTHNGSADTATDGNPDGNSQTFTTYKHEFPSPFFTWSPYNVLVGTTTNFTSQSRYYTTGAPTTPQNCVGSNCNYLWSTDDAEAVIGSSTAATTSIIFAHATGTRVTLNVTDVDSYVCSTSTTLLLNYDLPIWREVKAK